MTIAFKQLTVDDAAATDTRSDRQINAAFLAVCGTALEFAVSGNVNVSRPDIRNIVMFLHIAKEVVVCPALLWRRRNVAVCFRLLVDVDWSK